MAGDEFVLIDADSNQELMKGSLEDVVEWASLKTGVRIERPDGREFEW